MAYIGKKPEDKFRGLASYDTFTGDGSTTAFDVTNILPDGGTYDVEVFVDNVRQEGGAGKSYTIGNDGNGDLKRITFSVAPDNAAEIYVINPGRNTAILQVSDNTVTAAKLQTDAVTTAKIQDDAVTSAKIADGTIVSSNIAPGTIANDRLANTGITINGTSIALGASGEIVAGTDWQAVTVADGSTTLNAVAGKGYFLDTNAGVIEVFLPTSPTRGDTVILADYSGTFATNKCIINTGGALIDSTQGGPTPGNEFEITTNNAIVELVYVDAAKGWLVKDNTAPSALSTLTGVGGGYDTASYITATGGTITTVDTNYKVHTFTGDGCFVVSGGVGPLAVVDYLVIAGGGGGGGASSGGGGGGGGYRESYCATTSGCYTASPIVSGSSLSVTTTTYPITVGGGGAGGPGVSPAQGVQGSNSVFSTITSTGGGYGGMEAPGSNPQGSPGGSGGGSGAGPGCSPTPGGTGNTPPVSPSQGNPGGKGGVAPTGTGGGGGGATAQGQNAGGQGAPQSPSPAYGGQGGAGATTSINGTPTGRAGGGGGRSTAGAIPGQCGGGTGGSPGAGTAATANTGGGGGGGGSSGTGGAGGKGLVIIRYRFQ